MPDDKVAAGRLHSFQSLTLRLLPQSRHLGFFGRYGLYSGGGLPPRPAVQTLLRGGGRRHLKRRRGAVPARVCRRALPPPAKGGDSHRPRHLRRRRPRRREGDPAVHGPHPLRHQIFIGDGLPPILRRLSPGGGGFPPSERGDGGSPLGAACRRTRPHRPGGGGFEGACDRAKI